MAKTAEKILLVSLELFNSQGESNITSVDIANEMEISPGNLYYHFKGKEEIIAALVALWRERMSHLFSMRKELIHDISDLFAYLYLLAEGQHLFRFIVYNPVELYQRYPDVKKPIQRIIRWQEETVHHVLHQAIQKELLLFNNDTADEIEQLINQILTQSLNYMTLKGEDTASTEVLDKLVVRCYQCLQPYLADETRGKHQLWQSIADKRQELSKEAV